MRTRNYSTFLLSHTHTLPLSLTHKQQCDTASSKTKAKKRNGKERKKVNCQKQRQRRRRRRSYKICGTSNIAGTPKFCDLTLRTLLGSNPPPESFVAPLQLGSRPTVIEMGGKALCYGLYANVAAFVKSVHVCVRLRERERERDIPKGKAS